MTIVEDIGNKAGFHEIKHNWFKTNDIQLIRAPLPVGDYILYTDKVEDVIRRKQKRGIDVKKMDFLGSYDVCVDTKRDIQEIVGNLCETKNHERFRDECILAQNNGIKLYILIENEDGVKNLDDLQNWQNPRAKIYKWITTASGRRMKVLKYPGATPGKTLAKCMKTMSERYGVEFRFCSGDEAGARIIELLTSG